MSTTIGLKDPTSDMTIQAILLQEGPDSITLHFTQDGIQVGQFKAWLKDGLIITSLAETGLYSSGYIFGCQGGTNNG